MTIFYRNHKQGVPNAYPDKLSKVASRFRTSFRPAGLGGFLDSIQSRLEVAVIKSSAMRVLEDNCAGLSEGSGINTGGFARERQLRVDLGTGTILANRERAVQVFLGG